MSVFALFERVWKSIDKPGVYARAAVLMGAVRASFAGPVHVRVGDRSSSLWLKSPLLVVAVGVSATAAVRPRRGNPWLFLRPEQRTP